MLRPSPPSFTVKTVCFVTGTPVLPLFQARRALRPLWRNLSDVMNPAPGATLSATVSVSYSIRYSFTFIVHKLFIVSSYSYFFFIYFFPHTSPGVGCVSGESWLLELRGACASRCLSGSNKHKLESLTRSLDVCEF